MTCTVNLLFGGQLMDIETGIILNDEMVCELLTSFQPCLSSNTSRYRMISPYPAIQTRLASFPRPITISVCVAQSRPSHPTKCSYAYDQTPANDHYLLAFLQ